MYNDFKVANYPYSLTTPEMFARHLSHLFAGSVIDGFTVAPGSGLQVTLSPGNALVRYGSGITATSRFVTLTNSFNLTVTAPDASNPRLDSVVLYVDTSVNLPTVNASNPATAANVDGPGVAKAILVNGTAAATPTAPTAAQIQSAIGSSSYPYVVIATVQVDVGVSVIAANKITDVSSKTLKLPASGTAGQLVTDASGNVTASPYFWEELGRVELSGSSTSDITISIPASKRRRFYQVFATFEKSNSGTNWAFVQVNGDGGSNYYNIGWAFEVSGSAYWQNTAITNMAEVKMIDGGGSGQINLDISRSSSTSWWHFTNRCSGSNYAKQTGGRWQSANDITSISLISGGATLKAGTTFIVHGRN